MDSLHGEELGEVNRRLKGRWNTRQPTAAPSGGIERDEKMERDYIPLAAGYEFQTKGNGSTTRLLMPDGTRHPLSEPKHVLAALEACMRAQHAALRQQSAPGGEVAIVNALFEDLRDRRFLKWLFSETPTTILHNNRGEPLESLDAEVQAEIRKAWETIIREARQAAQGK